MIPASHTVSGVILPFTGRTRELATLAEWHAKRSHGLIIGEAGVGKSRLFAECRRKLPLLLSSRSVSLSRIFDALEGQLDLPNDGQKIPWRKARLLRELRDKGQTVVFDGLERVPPRMASFMEAVADSNPIWLSCRSAHPWDIGHIWPMLFRFAKLELRAFDHGETHSLVEAVVKSGVVAGSSLMAVSWLHQRARGLPSILAALLTLLSLRRHNPANAHDLRLLDVDCRIYELFRESTRNSHRTAAP